jgi:hypothetical protein
MLAYARHVLWLIALGLSLGLVSCGGGGGGSSSKTLAWDQANWDQANWQ